MVGVPNEARLLAPHRQKTTLCALGALLLQRATGVLALAPDSFNRLSGVDIALAVYSHVFNDEVYAEKAFCFHRRRCGQVYADVEVEDTITKDEISLSFLEADARGLIRAIAHRQD